MDLDDILVEEIRCALGRAGRRRLLFVHLLYDDGSTCLVSASPGAAARGAGSDSAPEPPPGPQIVEDILEAIGDQTLRAREVAARAGYQLNSHFRGVLASLCRGPGARLRSTRDGYQVIRRPPA